MIAKPVAQLVGLFEVLRGEEHRCPQLVDAAHLLPDDQAAHRIQPRGRLVEEEHVRLVHQRRGEVEPTLHAARVALDEAVRRVDQVDELEQLAGTLQRPAARELPNRRA